MFNLVPLIIFIPIIGLLLNILFGRSFRSIGSGILAATAAGGSFVIAVLLFIALQAQPEGATVFLADWIHVGTLTVPWSFKVDTLSVTMMLVVTGVGTLIHIYAIGYMKGDPRFVRFFVYLNLFLASMLVLVSGDSYLVMFVGWELVGLCSFLLIGFWFDRENGSLGIGFGNSTAAKKAFVVNRIGDFGFLLAMFLLFWAFGTLQFDGIFHIVETISTLNNPLFVAITLLLLLAATGKSAQIPLYVWLPDAMAGPTPVSALIHAATMVTAGVYMITRSAPLFFLAPPTQVVVVLIGAATAILAGSMALGQYDIKRVLAFSTISQLGFMIAAVGLGAYVAAIFHLVTHAFFKALLFMSAGSVIHGVEHGHHHAAHAGHGEHADASHAPAEFDPQDMRNMGGLRAKMKWTFGVYLVGSLALAGVIPLAGFWSKDEILADAFMVGLEGHWHGWAAYGLLTVAALFTAFYIGRQVFMVFFGQPRTDAAAHASESSRVMVVPLVILAGLSVVGGALNLPGLHTLTHWLEHTSHIYHSGEFNFLVAGISTVIALAGLGLAAMLYYRQPLTAGQPDPLTRLGGLFVAFNRKWWIDDLYNALFIRPYIWLSGFLADWVDWHLWHNFVHDSLIAGGFRALTRLTAEGIDLGFIDRVANGIADAAKGIARRLKPVESGYVRNYALGVFIGAVLILGVFLLAR